MAAGVQQVQITFAPGQIRQPSLWGKVLQPSGTILEYSDEKDVDVAIDKKSWIITFPLLPETTYLIFGIRGFHAAGMLTTCFVLFQVRNGQAADWQFPGHLARFEGKQAVVLAVAEENLQPLYDVLAAGKYGGLKRIQDMLKKENRDKPPIIPKS